MAISRKRQFLRDAHIQQNRALDMITHSKSQNYAHFTSERPNMKLLNGWMTLNKKKGQVIQFSVQNFYNTFIWATLKILHLQQASDTLQREKLRRKKHP